MLESIMLDARQAAQDAYARFQVGIISAHDFDAALRHYLDARKEYLDSLAQINKIEISKPAA